MPTARAMRYKSGLTPAHALRAFRFYPYCFCPVQQQHTLCRQHIPTLKPKPTQRVSLPQPVVND